MTTKISTSQGEITVKETPEEIREAYKRAQVSGNRDFVSLTNDEDEKNIYLVIEQIVWFKEE